MTYTNIGEPVNQGSIFDVAIERHLEKGNVKGHLDNC
jgi:hypothetical protein